MPDRFAENLAKYSLSPDAAAEMLNAAWAKRCRIYTALCKQIMLKARKICIFNITPKVYDIKSWQQGNTSRTVYVTLQGGVVADMTLQLHDIALDCKELGIRLSKKDWAPPHLGLHWRVQRWPIPNSTRVAWALGGTGIDEARVQEIVDWLGAKP